ncbi:MAG: ChaN family lipoprotein [bacterium]
MKKIIYSVFILLLFVSCAKSIQEKSDYRVFSTADYREISFSDFMKDLASSDVVLIGETHDSPFDHYVEEDLFKRVLKMRNITLSLEMFERDVQRVLNSYLAGEITEDSFLKASRPWENYESDYRNLVEFAKKNKIPVIAANIPRSLASLVSKHGSDTLNSISDIKDFFVKPFSTPDDYKQRFFDFFSMIVPGMPMSAMSQENIFLSQLFKDATMAFSINKALSEYPDRLVFMVCGEFHSDYHQGIYQQLKSINPGIKITTISISVDSADFDPLKADYLILK